MTHPLAPLSLTLRIPPHGSRDTHPRGRGPVLRGRATNRQNIQVPHLVCIRVHHFVYSCCFFSTRVYTGPCEAHKPQLSRAFPGQARYLRQEARDEEERRAQEGLRAARGPAGTQGTQAKGWPARWLLSPLSTKNA